MAEHLNHTAEVESSAVVIREAMGGRVARVAIILGSGLGGLADKIEAAVKIPYGALPGFPKLTVQGHAGLLIAGKLNGTEVIALAGRKHFYETDDPYPLKTMIRAVAKAGAEILFISNAAGGLNAAMAVPSLMLISDHINLMGLSPLAGPNDAEFGPRFFPLGDAWDAGLRSRTKVAAEKCGIDLHEGVYAAVRGPNFETPAEIRMLKTMGADAVGMSSVPDCLIARHCGMRVVGVSCITNLGAGLSDEVLSHAHTLESAAKGAAAFEALVTEAVGLL